VSVLQDGTTCLLDGLAISPYEMWHGNLKNRTQVLLAWMSSLLGLEYDVFILRTSLTSELMTSGQKSWLQAYLAF